MIRASSLLLLTVALSLAACDSGNTDDEFVAGPGQFSASITLDGGERSTFDGFASATNSGFILLDSVFVEQDSLRTIDSLETAFIVTLGELAGSGPGRFISFVRQGERPAPGTYTLGGFDRTEFTAIYTTLDRIGFPGGGSTFFAESGTLTVETSSEERIAGRFEFRARSFDLGEGPGDEQNATVRGAFDAAIRPLPEGFPRGQHPGWP